MSEPLTISNEAREAAVDIVQNVIPSQAGTSLSKTEMQYQEVRKRVELIADVIQPVISKLQQENEELKKDKERLEGLFGLTGHFQDGSGTVVSLFQDDATRDYFVTVGTNGKQSYYGETYRLAIDSAIQQEKAK